MDDIQQEGATVAIEPLTVIVEYRDGRWHWHAPELPQAGRTLTRVGSRIRRSCGAVTRDGAVNAAERWAMRDGVEIVIRDGDAAH